MLLLFEDSFLHSECSPFYSTMLFFHRPTISYLGVDANHKILLLVLSTIANQQNTFAKKTQNASFCLGI